jgi:hypothetical protein
LQNQQLAWENPERLASAVQPVPATIILKNLFELSGTAHPLSVRMKRA